jgi:hypothetical protein
VIGSVATVVSGGSDLLVLGVLGAAAIGAYIVSQAQPLDFNILTDANADPEGTPQDKKLTEGDLKKLMDNDIHPHDLTLCSTNP